MRIVHCWEDGPDERSTCLLERDHDGPHEFTSDDDYYIILAEQEKSG